MAARRNERASTGAGAGHRLAHATPSAGATKDVLVTDRLLNAAGFQLVWMACVGGAGSGRWWLGPLALLPFALWHFARSRHRLADARVALLAVGLGSVFDATLAASGVLTYTSVGPWTGLAPAWILSLWLGFALTLNHSLSWLHGRPLVAALFGGAGGPLSYWIGGHAWGAVTFTASLPLTLLVLSGLWMAVVPVLVAAAQRARRQPFVATSRSSLGVSNEERPA